MGNPFEAQRVTGWVTVPETFEHEFLADDDNPKGRITFPFPGAEILITSMSSDDALRMNDESRSYRLEDGVRVPVFSARRSARAMMRYRILDWRGVIGHDGKPVECTKTSKEDSSIIPGFAIFIRKHGELLDNIRDGNGSDEEKNCFRSPDGFRATEKKRTKAETASNATNPGPKG